MTSIFTKITFLFCISVITMGLIAWHNYENEKRVFENHVLDTLAQKGDKIVRSFEGGNDIIDDSSLVKISQLPSNKVLLLKAERFFSSMFIYRGTREYYLMIRYLDENFYYRYSATMQWDYTSWIFFILDIMALVLFYSLVIKILHPLKLFVEKMRYFSEHSFSPIAINSQDELGELAKSYNEMGESLEKALKHQELFLIQAGHELRTPIAKAKIAAALDKGEYAPLYRKVFHELDIITDELLKTQKLRIHDFHKEDEIFSDNVLVKALDKLLLDSYDNIEVKVYENFIFYGDEEYAVIIIRNLLDNALKYRLNKSVSVEVLPKKIVITNDCFTPVAQHHQGYGLGLTMCYEIAKNFHWKIEHSFTSSSICFEVIF